MKLKVVLLLPVVTRAHALLPLLPLLAVAQPPNATSPEPFITPGERARWVLQTTIDPAGLFGHAIGAGFGTWINSPHELGPHWTGFEKRFINNVATGAIGSAIEAGAGAFLGEDPRYVPAPPGTSLKGRILRAAKWTFVCRRADGSVGLAYARFIAIPASNGISDAFRPESERDAAHLFTRTAEGFGVQLSGNEWRELWPSVRKKLFH